MAREATGTRAGRRLCVTILFVGGVLVAILWLWLAVSLGVYAYRIWRRVTKGPKSARGASAARPEPGVSAPTYDPGLARYGQGTTGTTGAASPTGPVESGDRIGSTGQAEPAGEPRLTGGIDEAGWPGATASRAGLFAPATSPSPSPSPSSPGTTSRVTVATALAGIEMPCGLAPLVGSEARLDPYQVAFFTDDAAPAAVGAAVGDELERLGFALRSTSEFEAVAEREEVRVRVVLHPDAATEHAGGMRTYPTVPEGSVVVEFFT